MTTNPPQLVAVSRLCERRSVGRALGLCQESAFRHFRYRAGLVSKTENPSAAMASNSVVAGFEGISDTELDVQVAAAVAKSLTANAVVRESP